MWSNFPSPVNPLMPVQIMFLDEAGIEHLLDLPYVIGAHPCLVLGNIDLHSFTRQKSIQPYHRTPLEFHS